MANTAEFDDPSFDPVMAYLNDDGFRKAVHAPAVGPGTTVKKNWSETVGNNYEHQANESFAHVVKELLEGVGPEGNFKQRILVISGLNDAKDCNFLGTNDWLQKLDGTAAARFKMAGTTQWVDPFNEKHVLGFEQDGGLLTWLKVLNAGHLAVLDQPLLIGYILKKLGLKAAEIDVCK